MKDINDPAGGSSFFGADHTTTNFAWALYAGTSYDITPQLSAGSLLSLCQPRHRQERRVSPPSTAPRSYSGLFVKDITSNDLLLGFRYKLQHEAPLYAVK